MFAREVNDIEWSTRSYSTRDLMSEYPAPLLVRVTQGHCGLEDTDSLGQGQVIRIHRWLKQQRVVAIDARGRNLSIPLDFDVLFEVVPDKKRTLSKRRKMLLADIIRQYSLPKKVRLSPRHLTSVQTLDGGRLGVRMTLEPIDLIRLHQEVYFIGNAVNFGELDPSVLSIPIHHDLELSLALGLAGGEKDWQRLMRDLDNVVAKRVRFPTVQGNKKITFYTSEMDDKGIKKLARSPEVSVVQKRHQSLDRAFRYGTLQRIRAAEREAKPRSSSVSTNPGSLNRTGQTQPDVRGTARRFAKRHETRLKRKADARIDTVSIAGTSVSATSVSESTDTMDDMDSNSWSISQDSRSGRGDFDDDVSDMPSDDELDETVMTRSLFGSVSNLSLFNPTFWSGNVDGNVDGHRHQQSGWNARRGRRTGRLSSGTSISMGDLGSVCRKPEHRENDNGPSFHRGLPDGRSVNSAPDSDGEQSTDL